MRICLKNSGKILDNRRRIIYNFKVATLSAPLVSASNFLEGFEEELRYAYLYGKGGGYRQKMVRA